MEKYIEYNNLITQRNNIGFFKLENDKKAIKEFKKVIEKNILTFSSHKEKINYLIDNKYYIDFLKTYSMEFIDDMYKYAYEFKFQFASFMAISKFYDDYALKSLDKTKILERYEDRIVSVALFLGQGDQEVVKNYVYIMMSQQYQPATPTFLNSGLYNSGELVSCFLLDIDDSLNSINYNLSTAMQLSKIGGGVGINVSKLRARGESVKGHAGAAKGVLPVLKLLEDSFSYVDQLGKRPGAGAAYLSIFHADLIEFLDTKKINADEKSRIQSLSLGVLINDKFMELVAQNKEVCLFYPHSIYKEYKKNLEDIDMNLMYDELVSNSNVMKKRYSARDIMQQIAIIQFESGYPYLIFIDTANKMNPLKNTGKIMMSNLCTEIFQNQETSVINDYEIENEIKNDVSCNLGSLNLVNLVEKGDYESVIYNSIEMLSQVSNISKIDNAPGVNKGNSQSHAIGLGAMNLHGLLSKNKISYESEQALELVDALFTKINFYSILSSMKMAKKFNNKFKGFENSEYATGDFFKQYLEKDFIYKNTKIEKLIGSVPTVKEWKKLIIDVKKHGMYNAYRLAIAPTQSISYVQNSTASIAPIVSQVETRTYGNSTTYYPMPYMNENNVLYYKSAYNMDQMKLIDLVSTIQKHVDQGISTVLYVTNETSTKDLVKYYYYAWRQGLKSIYYVRTKNLTVDECISCSV